MLGEANISTETRPIINRFINLLSRRKRSVNWNYRSKKTNLIKFMVYLLYKICQLWLSKQYIFIHFMYFVNRTVPGYLVRMQIKQMSSILLFVIVSITKEISSYHKLWYSNP